VYREYRRYRGIQGDTGGYRDISTYKNTTHELGIQSCRGYRIKVDEGIQKHHARCKNM